MSDNNIDTSLFDVYSTRHAETSTATRKGVNIDCIKKLQDGRKVLVLSQPFITNRYSRTKKFSQMRFSRNDVTLIIN